MYSCPQSLLDAIVSYCTSAAQTLNMYVFVQRRDGRVFEIVDMDVHCAYWVQSATYLLVV